MSGVLTDEEMDEIRSFIDDILDAVIDANSRQEAYESVQEILNRDVAAHVRHRGWRVVNGLMFLNHKAKR